MGYYRLGQHMIGTCIPWETWGQSLSRLGVYGTIASYTAMLVMAYNLFIYT